MKSYNHLFEKAISDEIMNAALTCAAEGKYKRPEVQYILKNRIKYRKELRQRLIDGALVPLIHNATIRKDGYRNKKRIIVKPHFNRYEPEQWIHHIVIQTLKDILMKGMYVYSCGSVPGRGIHYGKKYLERFIRNNPKELKYVLKIDIHHFYESINIDILKERFRQIIHDERMLDLIFYILDSNEYILDGKHYKKGLVIGFYPSQWFANFYLQQFDHYIKEELKIKCYVRYMDDIVIFGKNKRELHRQLEAIKAKLAELDLELKSNYQIFKFDYVDKNGKPMLENCHEILIQKNKSFVGTGHNSEIVSDKEGVDWIFYHAVSVENPSGRVLMLDRIYWDEDGWPSVKGMSPSLKAAAPVF